VRTDRTSHIKAALIGLGLVVLVIGAIALVNVSQNDPVSKLEREAHITVVSHSGDEKNGENCHAAYTVKNGNYALEPQNSPDPACIIEADD
jgi:uncharacterized protein YpmB